VGEVEEGLLLQPRGKANGILQVNLSTFVIEGSPERRCVRDDKTVLDSIVGMKTPGA
jgi:hypothetical protein